MWFASPETGSQSGGGYRLAHLWRSITSSCAGHRADVNNGAFTIVGIMFVILLFGAQNGVSFVQGAKVAGFTTFLDTIELSVIS